MPYVGNTPSIVDDIANEIEYDIPAPIRDESELEPFDTYVEGVAITEQTGTFMHVEAFATHIDEETGQILANDTHDYLA